jgi:transposase-like protein
MGKEMKERRVYTKEFKAEAAVLAEKREKPARQIAQELEVNEKVFTGGYSGQRRRRKSVRRTFPDMDGLGTRSWFGCGKKRRR